MAKRIIKHGYGLADVYMYNLGMDDDDIDIVIDNLELVNTDAKHLYSYALVRTPKLNNYIPVFVCNLDMIRGSYGLEMSVRGDTFEKCIKNVISNKPSKGELFMIKQCKERIHSVLYSRCEMSLMIGNKTLDNDKLRERIVNRIMDRLEYEIGTHIASTSIWNVIDAFLTRHLYSVYNILEFVRDIQGYRGTISDDVNSVVYDSDLKTRVMVRFKLTNKQLKG